MSKEQEWISCDTKPEVNGGYFSKKLKLKIGNKIKTGYYDGYLLKWFFDDKDDMSTECKPTHWKLLNSQLNKAT